FVASYPGGHEQPSDSAITELVRLTLLIEIEAGAARGAALKALHSLVLRLRTLPAWSAGRLHRVAAGTDAHARVRSLGATGARGRVTFAGAEQGLVAYALSIPVPAVAAVGALALAVVAALLAHGSRRHAGLGLHVAGFAH